MRFPIVPAMWSDTNLLSDLSFSYYNLSKGEFRLIVLCMELLSR